MTSAILRAREAVRGARAAGHPVRLLVDGRRREVLLPPAMRTAQGAELVLDVPVDATDLVLDAPSLSVTLRLEGAGFTCGVPWPAIHGVMDVATGESFRIAEHRPEPTLPPDRAADLRFACSFCGADRRDRRKVVATAGASICETCIADVAGIVAASEHAPALGAGIANMVVGLPIEESRRGLRAAAELAASDDRALRAVLELTDPDDPETTLHVLSRLATRTPADALLEAEMLHAAGRFTDALACLRERVSGDISHGADLARRVRVLRCRIASGVTPDVAAGLMRELHALGSELMGLAEDDRGWLRPSEHVHTTLEAAIGAGQIAVARQMVDDLLGQVPDEVPVREMEVLVLRAERSPRFGAAREALLARLDSNGARARALRAL